MTRQVKEGYVMWYKSKVDFLNEFVNSIIGILQRDGLVRTGGKCIWSCMKIVL